MIINNKVLSKSIKKIDGCFHKLYKPTRYFLSATEGVGVRIFGLAFPQGIAVEVEITCRVLSTGLYILNRSHTAQIISACDSKSDIFFTPVQQNAFTVVANTCVIDVEMFPHDIALFKTNFFDGEDCRSLFCSDTTNVLSIDNETFCQTYELMKPALQVRTLHYRDSDGVAFEVSNNELIIQSTAVPVAQYAIRTKQKYTGQSQKLRVAIPSKVMHTIYKNGASNKTNKSPVELCHIDDEAQIKFENLTVAMKDGLYYYQEYHVEAVIPKEISHSYLIDPIQLEQFKTILREASAQYKKMQLKKKEAVPIVWIKTAETGIDISIPFIADESESDIAEFYAYKEFLNLEKLQVADVIENTYSIDQLLIFLEHVTGFQGVEIVFYDELKPCTIYAENKGVEYAGVTMAFQRTAPYEPHEFLDAHTELFDAIPF